MLTFSMLAPGSMLINSMAVFKNWVMLPSVLDARLMSGVTTGETGVSNANGVSRINRAPRYRMRVAEGMAM